MKQHRHKIINKTLPRKKDVTKKKIPTEDKTTTPTITSESVPSTARKRTKSATVKTEVPEKTRDKISQMIV